MGGLRKKKEKDKRKGGSACHEKSGESYARASRSEVPCTLAGAGTHNKGSAVLYVPHRVGGHYGIPYRIMWSAKRYFGTRYI